LPPSIVICPPTLTGHWLFEVEKLVGGKILRPLHYVGPPSERIRSGHVLMRSHIDLFLFGLPVHTSVRPNRSIFFCLSVCLCLSAFVCLTLSACLSSPSAFCVNLSVYLPVFLLIHLFICVAFCTYVCPVSMHLSVFLSIHLFICVAFCTYIMSVLCLCICLFFCLSIYLSICFSVFRLQRSIQNYNLVLASYDVVRNDIDFFS